MDRLDKLRELETYLYKAMSVADIRTLAALARQYRETIREIEEIEGAANNDDEIAEILSERDAAGKASAVR